MEKEKKAIITLEHLRDDGRFLSTTLTALDVCLDEGFVIKTKTAPVVKILRLTTTPYIIIGPTDPIAVVEKIKKSIVENRKLHLDYSIFDQQLLTHEESFALLKQTAVPSITEIARAVRHHDYLKVLGVQSLGHKVLPLSAAHVFARTLPTPNKPVMVSKFQYFKFLMQVQWKN